MLFRFIQVLFIDYRRSAMCSLSVKNHGYFNAFPL